MNTWKTSKRISGKVNVGVLEGIHEESPQVNNVGIPGGIPEKVAENIPEISLQESREKSLEESMKESWGKPLIEFLEKSFTDF